MKKLLKTLLVCCVCLFTTFTFISCAETTNASEETPAGETNSNDQTSGENIIPNNPVEPPVTPTPHEHTYGEWQITTQPTCTEQGEKQRTCTDTDCEHVETEVISAKGHKYKTTEEPATCTANGTKTHTCDCGDSYTETITATGHQHNETVKVVYATCTEDGYTLKHCHCGDEIQTDIQPATGHNFDENTHKCTCGLYESPLENLVGSYWYITGKKLQNTWVIYFDSNSTYCSYYVKDDTTYELDETKPTNKYNGTYTLDKLTNTIYFIDEYLKDDKHAVSSEFELLFTSEQTIGEFILSGNFNSIDTITTFKFAGYKVL